MEKIELKPASVFHYFEEICKVPRPSKKEEMIIAYLMNFAKEHGLWAHTDAIHNVYIKKPGSAGCEHLPAVMLQGHTDIRLNQTGKEQIKHAE